MKKKALITGIFGQDGSYLCELLNEQGYEVHGIIRQNLSENSFKIQKYLAEKNVSPILHQVELNDYFELKNLLCSIKPDEIYHLAAFHVSSQGVKEDKSLYGKQLFDYNVISTSNILSICNEYLKNSRILTAGSCLMFDNSETDIQDENTPFNTNSLYGLSKVTENSLVKYYRGKGLYCSTAILYNHESSRRNNSFVTKKIITNMIKIKNGEIDKFTLANLDTKKDWGYAKDYANGMFLMNQQKTPQDFVLSSGELHTIEEFIQICADVLNINNWKKHIIIDSNIIDRKINNTLFGNCTKAKQELDWCQTISFDELIKLMIQNEIDNKLI